MTIQHRFVVLLVLFASIDVYSEEYLLQFDVVETDGNVVIQSCETLVNGIA